MQKTLEFTMPGIKGKMTGVYEGRSKKAVIIGVDTAIGFAMAHSMRRAGFDVIGFGEMTKAPCDGLLEYHRTDYTSYDDIPDECNRLLFCHDAALHTERHAPALDALCKKLAENRMGIEYKEPEQIVRDRLKDPKMYRHWVDFKCARIAYWYSLYRKAFDEGAAKAPKDRNSPHPPCIRLS